MLEFAAATTGGLSFALGFYALREEFAAFWRSDVEKTKQVIWRFTPEATDPRPYVAAKYAVYLVLFLLAFALVPIKPLVPVVWLASLAIPGVVVSVLWKRRRRKLDDQLPAAVRSISTQLAAGIGLSEAVRDTAERAPQPVATELRVLVNSWDAGVGIADALEQSKRRLNLPNFTILASTLQVNRERGGDIGLLLEKLARALESVQEMQQAVRASTAEGRLNVKVLALAPAAILALVSIIDAEAVGMLFTTNQGRAILGVALTLTGIGIVIAHRIVNADV